MKRECNKNQRCKILTNKDNHEGNPSKDNKNENVRKESNNNDSMFEEDSIFDNFDEIYEGVDEISEDKWQIIDSIANYSTMDEVEKKVLLQQVKRFLEIPAPEELDFKIRIFHQAAETAPELLTILKEDFKEFLDSIYDITKLGEIFAGLIELNPDVIWYFEEILLKKINEENELLLLSIPLKEIAIAEMANNRPSELSGKLIEILKRKIMDEENIRIIGTFYELLLPKDLPAREAVMGSIIEREKKEEDLMKLISLITELSRDESAIEQIYPVFVEKIKNFEDTRILGWCVSQLFNKTSTLPNRLLPVLREKIRQEENLQNVVGFLCEICTITENYALKFMDIVEEKFRLESDYNLIGNLVSVIASKNENIARKLIPVINEILKPIRDYLTIATIISQIARVNENIAMGLGDVIGEYIRKGKDIINVSLFVCHLLPYKMLINFIIQPLKRRFEAEEELSSLGSAYSYILRSSLDISRELKDIVKKKIRAHRNLAAIVNTFQIIADVDEKFAEEEFLTITLNKLRSEENINNLTAYVNQIAQVSISLGMKFATVLKNLLVRERELVAGAQAITTLSRASPKIAIYVLDTFTTKLKRENNWNMIIAAVLELLRGNRNLIPYLIEPLQEKLESAPNLSVMTSILVQIIREDLNFARNFAEIFKRALKRDQNIIAVGNAISDIISTHNGREFIELIYDSIIERFHEEKNHAKLTTAYTLIGNNDKEFTFRIKSDVERLEMGEEVRHDSKVVTEGNVTTCISCGAIVKRTDDRCSACGFELIKCKICGKVIGPTEDLITVPCCGSSFHKSELVKWLEKNNKCPYCSRPLSFGDLL